VRILYVASAIELGGASGGSTHVSEVACGLKKLGHEVLVVARGAKREARNVMGECEVAVRYVKHRQQLALLELATIRKALDESKPDVVMERFYNFAGGGVLMAHRRDIPSLLEVNAPMIDPPGSLKSKIDRVLLRSMRRWAVRQALWSAAIVTPLNTTVPSEVPRKKIHELPWGANVDQFEPSIREKRRGEIDAIRLELGLSGDGPVAVFLGSFRAWHGVAHFAEAARRLISTGSTLSFLAIGGGPELAPLRETVASWGLPAGRLVFAGSQAHERIPLMLALGDVGVAPFDLSAYQPLRTFGFYWSPLKVFEYMSMALPVVTIDVPPLDTIVRENQEGLLYPSGDIDALVGALRRLEGDAEMRKRMGASARERVVERYSWHAHCVALDGILKEIAV
jgi:glycosyltransferase involved in cell wall biosynthesis